MSLTKLVEWDITPTNNQPSITLQQCLDAGANGVMISNAHYHALPGISGSNLSLLMESNRHLDNKHLFNDFNTPALTFGTLVHTMVLEPDNLLDDFVVMPNEFNLRTQQGKADKAEFEQHNQQKQIVSHDEFKKASKMAQNVRAICGDVIERGIKERSLFAEIDGLILKCRLDIDLEEKGDDYDLKTITLGTKDFSDRTLEQHIKKFNYHLSAAFRNIIRSALGKPVRDSYLIFVNTGNGHMVRVIKIHPAWIAEAEQKVQDLLSARRFYLSTKIDHPIINIDNSYREYGA